MNHKHIQNEEEERAFLEWQMKQPGYWKNELFVAVMSAVTLFSLLALGFGIWGAVKNIF